jgi:glycosyltransferase involved in cell wall biosynthesis
MTDHSTTGAAAVSTHIELSVVIPLYNEEENIDPAVEEVLAALDDLGVTSELILVDDGSSDLSGELAISWHDKDSRVRVVRLRRNFGQTAAISAGFDFARGRTVVVMDGDQQNDPADIGRLLDKISEGYDVVSGWRTHRQDALILRKIPSKIANALISKATGTVLHDYGCTLKAYDAEVVRHLRLYGELHRFIPALAALSGARIVELPVNHRPRTRGASKYGISRAPRVLLDLLTVKFLVSYLSRPMQFFGRLALGCLAAASTSAGIAGVRRVSGTRHTSRHSGAAAAWLLAAGQFLTAGILGEVGARVYFEARGARPYAIRELVGIDALGDRPWSDLPLGLLEATP